MLEIKNLNIKVDDRYLVKDLSLTINNDDKLAIIGEEGNGKSTLLKAILGICDYATINGFINTHHNRIGYLEQTMNDKYMDLLVKDYLLDNDNYYKKSNELYKYMNDLSLNKELLDQVINTLSGGEKVKISILKLLINDSDILLLDEPTNDLDIDTLEWLERFINNCNKPIMFVSHDETLLSNTVNIILHLEQQKKKSDCKHTLLKTNYDDYVETRLRSIEKQTSVARNEKREYDKQQEKLRIIREKVEYQLNTISRSDPHGAQMLKRKMHSIKAQETRLDNKDLTKVPDVEEHIFFKFEDNKVPNSKTVIHINFDELKIGNKLLSKSVKLDVIGNSKICIIGKNGVGKSTLLKLIYDELKNRSDFVVGYMPQNYDDILSNYKYPMEFLCSSNNKEEVTRARMYLGNMNFTSEEMVSNINSLSNGTKAKLFLIKLVLKNCNVLLLDEPTRNLSPLSNPVIRMVLKDFKGCIISVSHDRKYINEVVDTIYELTSDGLKPNML